MSILPGSGRPSASKSLEPNAERPSIEKAKLPGSKVRKASQVVKNETDTAV